MSWPYAYTPYIWPTLALAALLAVLGAYAWRRRRVPAALSFAVLASSMTLWGLGSALELAAVEPGTKLFWFQFQAILKLPTAILALVFVLTYASLQKWLTRARIAVLILFCVTVAMMVVTNPAHRLFYPTISVGAHVRVTYGPAFWATLLPIYLLFLLQAGVLVWLIIRAPLYRWPSALILGQQIVVRIAFVAEAMGINPLAPLDPVVLFGILGSLAYFLAFYQFHILGVVPIGRDMAVERMVDGVVILDAESRIVDVNPAAAQVLALARRDAIGHTAARALTRHPNLTKLLEQPMPGSGEMTLAGAREPRCFQVHVSPLVHPSGFPLGWLMLIQDVTEQKRAGELLLQQQRTRAMVQERERLARELHDGLGQMLAAAHLQASTAKRLLAQGAHAEANDCLDRLGDMTLDAEADVREYLLGAKTIYSTEHPFFPSLRQYLARLHHQFGLRVELTVAPELEARGLGLDVQVQVLRIVQEALSNVRKHARANCARVSFAMAGGRARIVVSDQGGGFDPPAVAVRSEGFGLRAMRERAESIGASLTVNSAPGKGTDVEVLVPIAEARGQNGEDHAAAAG